MKKVRNILIVLTLFALVFFVYFRYFFVFGTGVKTGELNFVVYKGYIFKTYEGRLIQQGFRSEKAGQMGSNEFDFSVARKDVAERLMRAGGEVVELYYKEYKGVLPWRGYNKFVVDSIVSISKPMTKHAVTLPPQPLAQ